MNRRLRRLKWGALGIVIILAFPASASGFHEYGIGKEDSPGDMNGLSVLRVDKEVTTSPGTSCTTPYAAGAHPTYQTQWVLFGGSSNWVEIGTADQCNDYDFLFWGYGANGAWHSVGVLVNTPGGAADHVFELVRVDNGISKEWRWKLDGSVKGTITWNIAGTYVEAGFESYDAGAVSTNQFYKALSWFDPTCCWRSWAGRDGSTVGLNMCGHWASDQEWHAGENGVC